MDYEQNGSGVDQSHPSQPVEQQASQASFEHVAETPVPVVEAPKPVIVLGCTCKDKFKTEVCPVHFGSKAKEAAKKLMIITDEDMVSGEVRSWSGYTYTCQKCNSDSIMYMMKYCGHCGAKLVIESDKLTARINELQEKM